MNARAYKQVDVFTSVPLYGNALAVVLDAEGLSAADMQRIAAWTNLSETAFVLPTTQPGASHRVRIFTPRSELPFAGHPSVGTAHALIEGGRIDPTKALLQECAAGLLPMRVVGEGSARRIFVRAPRARSSEVDASVIAVAAHAIGTAVSVNQPPQIFDNGPKWLICDLGHEATVRALLPDMAAIEVLGRKMGLTGISVFGRAADKDYALAVRTFCPGFGIPEDPVTGSANATIGAYLLATGQLADIGADYRASQGREVGRDGFVDVHVDAASGEVDIGGQSVTGIDGTFVLADSGEV